MLGEIVKPTAPPEDAATDPRNQLKQGIFTNVKILVLVGFVALLAYNATNKIFTADNMKDICDVVKMLIIIEGVVHLAVVLGNMYIKALEVKAFMADGVLSETERRALSDVSLSRLQGIRPTTEPIIMKDP
jgi:hypothetical protein